MMVGRPIAKPDQKDRLAEAANKAHHRPTWRKLGCGVPRRTHYDVVVPDSILRTLACLPDPGLHT